MTSRPRRIGGIVLLVLAALLVPVAVIGTWTARTVTDTDAFVARVVPVASSPEVQALVEQEMTAQVTQAIDTRVAPRVTGAIDELAAPDLVKALLRDLAGSLGGAVETRTASIVAKVVEAPEFATAFEEATRTAHTDLVATLDGDATNNGAVVTEGDTVSIKLATVGNAVRQELVVAGFSFVDRLPTLEASVPITTVEQLEQWQGYYRLLTVLVWLGPLLVLVFAVAGAWLLRDVAVAGLWFTGAALLALVAAVVALRVVVSGATDRLADPVAADAARAVVSTFSDTLVRNATVVGILLVIGLAVAAYVAARRRLAPTHRHRLRAEDAGRPVSTVHANSQRDGVVAEQHGDVGGHERLARPAVLLLLHQPHHRCVLLGERLLVSGGCRGPRHAGWRGARGDRACQERAERERAGPGRVRAATHGIARSNDAPRSPSLVGHNWSGSAYFGHAGARRAFHGRDPETALITRESPRDGDRLGDRRRRPRPETTSTDDTHTGPREDHRCSSGSPSSTAERPRCG